MTQDDLKELLDYDPNTGLFHWRVNPPRGRRLKGKVAGTKKSHKGYVTILIHRRRYKAHNLVWLYVHGKWPADQLDHIDRDGTNNAVSNLREATASENNQNKLKQANNTSGYAGITIRKDRPKKPYRVAVCVQGRSSRGHFASLSEARAWREKTVKQLHPFAPVV